MSTRSHSDEKEYAPSRSFEERGTYVEFVVYGKPEPAGSKRAFVIPNTRRAVVTDANAMAKPWKAQVSAGAAGAMQEQERPLLDGPLYLVIIFYVPRPKSVTRGYPTVKPDVTKLVRGCEDAMTGIVYRDDAQIVSQHASKHYGEPARAEIRVEQLLPGEEGHGRAARAS